MVNGKATNSDITGKVWALSHVLRDDGIVFHKYLSELTYLLFLKIADELGNDGVLPPGCNWKELVRYKGKSLVGHYRKLLTRLGEDSVNPIVRQIFGFPTTVFSHDENLRKVLTEIASIDWASAKGDGFGTIYESLLERNATESRSGAGQYFTPRPLVECMVRLLRPQPGTVVQDPAAGTGGFLIAANEYLRSSHSVKVLERKKTRFEGMEIERDTYRLCLMNLFLHGINGQIVHGDALTADAASLSSPDAVLANPPFGSAAGGARPKRSDLPYQTSNKQLMFLQHIYLALTKGGRGAVVVPDNVLFEAGVGRRVREDLMAKCDLHTVLRLPQGIFYAQGVNTNILFFDKGRATEEVWFYDLRTNVRRFNKSNPLTDETFASFIEVFGDPSKPGFGRKERRGGERFRRFSRRDIAAKSDNLDVTWLPNARSVAHDIDDIESVLEEIVNHIQTALTGIEEVEKEILGQ